MKAEEIVEMILKAARESRVLSGGVYKDEPIVRTGRQAFGGKGGKGGKGSPSAGTGRVAQAPRASRPQQAARAKTEQPAPTIWSLGESFSEVVARTTGQVPPRIAEMRELARKISSRSFAYADPKLFYAQARLMEDYTDSCPYVGEFVKYFPTYEDMTTAQLRGYFTWRTRWRAGEVANASLSYLFVHVYELLCGVGVRSPLEGFEALGRLRDAYGKKPGNEALVSYLGLWMPDYVIYYGLDRALLGRDAEGAPLERATGVLDQAERAILAAGEKVGWRDALGALAGEELVFALTAASTYRLERSKVFTDHFDELEECCAAVFARMVDHCAHRRKRGFVEGLFGAATAEPYTMFRSAIFHSTERHPDCEVKLESGVLYRCRGGAWTRCRPHSIMKSSSELGDILHEIDRTLRLRLGGIPELKERELPKYQRAIIEQEVDACLARIAAEEAAKVHIDRSVLRGIRDASVRTREALLVDEERADAPEPATEGLAFAASAAPVQVPEPLPAASAPSPAPEPPASAAAPTGAVAGLSADDAAILRSLLDGTFNAAALQAKGVMVSLAADRINEALFDLIGDAVIEFEGDEPHVVEDYAEDVREVLS